MNVTGIGIQTIRPTTATTAQQQSNDRDADAAPVASRQVPQPPKGFGKLVNKYV
jgi:hypothetical protein